MVRNNFTIIFIVIIIFSVIIGFLYKHQISIFNNSKFSGLKLILGIIIGIAFVFALLLISIKLTLQ